MNSELICTRSECLRLLSNALSASSDNEGLKVEYSDQKMTPGADAVVKIAEALDVSCDYLLVDDAPRRAFRAPDTILGDRVTGLDELTDEDRHALLHMLDALLAKNRVRNALRETG